MIATCVFQLEMFSISTRRALLVLGFFFFLLENTISTAIETDQSFGPAAPDLKRFEQVIESGSTLTLTCIGIFDNVSTVDWASVPSLTRIIMVILKKGSHFNKKRPKLRIQFWKIRVGKTHFQKR